MLDMSGQVSLWQIAPAALVSLRELRIERQIGELSLLRFKWFIVQTNKQTARFVDLDSLDRLLARLPFFFKQLNLTF
jgi:hypothetical protein